LRQVGSVPPGGEGEVMVTFHERVEVCAVRFSENLVLPVNARDLELVPSPRRSEHNSGPG
jgi:hypothetical protein